MTGFIVSTIAFFVAAFFINRYLDEHGIDKGMARSALVFVLTSLISYGTAEATDWVVDRFDPPQKTAADAGRKTDDIAQLLKTVQDIQGR